MSSAPTLYRRWHDRYPDGLHEINVLIQRPRRLGTITEILYQSDKWGRKGGKVKRYIHAFTSPVKILSGKPAIAQAAELGTVEHVAYKNEYGHEQVIQFPEPLPVLAAADDEKAVLLIVDHQGRSWTVRGGDLQITPRGIEG